MTMSARFEQSEAVLRAVLESPQRIVIFALDRHYRYLAFNQNHARTMLQIWGARIEVGMNMLEIIARVDDREKARRNFDRALAGESFSLIEEYGDVSKERRFYEDVYCPVRNDEGQIIGIAVYLTDITEQRQAELELARYRSHLEELVRQRTEELAAAHQRFLHAQKLESLGLLAGGIAHDFNNLLAVVLARAELCARRVGTDETSQAHLAIIREAALSARMLTKQLLGYAGKGKFLVEVHDLSEVVRDIEQLLRASMPKEIRLEFEFCERPVPVLGDASQLRQVVLNLVTNAAEAVGARPGRVLVRTSLEELDQDTVRHACVANELTAGSYACLEVTDDGSGISDAVRAKLFDPFFSTKLAGRGLGLAAVLGIVTGHRGTILLETSPAGSRFRVVLPVADAAAIQKAHGPRTISSPPLDRCVLVVDDEPAVRASSAECLRSMGLSVFEADGGVSACQIFSQRAQEIAVVLLDLAMPDMNGAQTLRELKRIRRDVHVILVTAYAEDEFRDRFAPGDLSGYLTKPFSRDEIAEVLHRVLSLPAAADPAEAPAS